MRDRSLDVEWKAFELRPREAPISPREKAEKERMIEETWPDLRRLASESFGLDLNRPKIDIDTRLAHVAAKVAHRWNRGDQYHHALFSAHWQQGRDISDRAVLAQLAQEIGIDAEAFDAALDDDDLLGLVLQEVAESRQIGISGVPATVVSGKYLLSGCRPHQELAEILDRIEREVDGE